MSRHDWPDRFARRSVSVLTIAVIFGVVSGAVVAIIWRPDVDWQSYQPPLLLTALGYLVAVLLTLPNLLRGAWRVLRGRWRPGLQAMFFCVGAVVVFLGAEAGSHYLVPCGLVDALGWGAPDWGVLGRESVCVPRLWTPLSESVYSRLHLLHHSLLGGLPMLLAYRLLLRRWPMVGP